MAKILVTPRPPAEWIAEHGEIPPFEVEGKRLTSKHFDDCGIIYYINGRSYPAEIVTILEGEVEENVQM